MRELIQAEFLAPLADVYGAYGPRIADELAKRLSPMTGEAMRSAAERLIRTRKAKGFPTFPDCLAALKERGSAVVAGGDVTAETYAGRAKDFALTAGSIPIIERKRDGKEWAAWRAYFKRIGMHGSSAMMAEAEKWTVPAKHPADFDTTAWDLRDVEAEPQNRREGASSPAKGLAGALDMGRATMQPEWQRRDAERAAREREAASLEPIPAAEARLEELRGSPASLVASPSLRAKLSPQERGEAAA